MAEEIDWSALAGSSSWNKLFDRYYRKREIYEMAWERVDLSKMVVASSRFSGPIAMMHDTQRVSQITTGSLRPTLDIYTASGNLLASVLWKHGRLVEMGWSDDERLVCVIEDGTVLVYSPLGRLAETFDMGEECKSERVLLACVWGSGVVCLTRAFSLVYVDNLLEPVPRRMPRLADRIQSNPTCMAVIEPHLAASKGLEVLLAVDKTIFVVTMAGAEDQKLTAGPMRRLSVCPNGKMLACFTHDGFVWVVTSDFSKNLSEFPTKSQVAPKQLVWCGTDSVVLYWDKIVLMIGPYGDWVKYSFDQPLALFAEVPFFPPPPRPPVRFHDAGRALLIKRLVLREGRLTACASYRPRTPSSCTACTTRQPTSSRSAATPLASSPPGPPEALSSTR